MNKTNYQKLLDDRIKSLGGVKKKLLLHSCCAPCSSACLEYLASYFDITVYYYNPNITAKEEYEHRVAEQQRLIRELSADVAAEIKFAEGVYEPSVFLEAVKGFENCPEGGDRCCICFKLRLSSAGRYAAENGFDMFTTTLTISPLKNAQLLNELGLETAEECGVEYLTSDFKKKNGYKRSIELSAKYGLYRQDYCGCTFSRVQREREKAAAGIRKE